MWFTDNGTPAIGRIAADGTVTEFTAGLPSGAVPYAIAAGPGGNMWFTDYRGAAIGRISPSGAITEFSLPQRYPAAQTAIPASRQSITATRVQPRTISERSAPAKSGSRGSQTEG
jgi:streptogramin lyase